MINPKTKTILHVNLEKKEAVTKSYPDLRNFVGGFGLSSKLTLDYIESDPIIFSIGPLNGLFPFASKTCCTFLADGKFIDTYVGGNLSSRLRFTGVDAIVFEGESLGPVAVSITDTEVTFSAPDTDTDMLGIPRKRSVLDATGDKVVVDSYFAFGDQTLITKLRKKGIYSVVVSCSQDFALENLERYQKHYEEILGKSELMLVQKSDHPSCSGCPMGCTKASIGEVGGNVLVHSLVVCIYAEPIYNHIPTVFACLSSLGYDYRHEELEALPDLTHSTIEKIYEKIAGSKLERE